MLQTVILVDRPEFNNNTNQANTECILRIHQTMPQKGLKDWCEVFCRASASHGGMRLNPDARLITARPRNWK